MTETTEKRSKKKNEKKIEKENEKRKMVFTVIINGFKLH